MGRRLRRPKANEISGPSRGKAPVHLKTLLYRTTCMPQAACQCRVFANFAGQLIVLLFGERIKKRTGTFYSRIVIAARDS